MNGLQITEPGKARIVSIPVPEPSPAEVLVKPATVNTCPQWDMHIWRGEPMFAGKPLEYPYTVGQPGHEMAGVVESVGSDVRGFAPGDRVAAWKDPGHTRQGCYAEYVCFDSDHLLHIPEGSQFAEYSSLELAMCVAVSFIDLLKTTKIRGKRFGVSGLGGAGIIAAQLAKAEGAAEVVGFDLLPAREELALSHGVDKVLDPTTCSREDADVEVSLDCVGARESAEFLMDVTSEIVSIFGVQREPFSYPMGKRRLKLFGYAGHSKEGAEYALNRLTSGELRIDRLAGITLPLSEYAAGVEMLLKQEVVKVCYKP